MLRTLAEVETFVDVEFEDDVRNVYDIVIRLRRRPYSLGLYKQACQSIRKAKLLRFNLERGQNGRRCLGAERLLKLAEEVVALAAKSEPNIPPASRTEFEKVKAGLRNHAAELKS